MKDRLQRLNDLMDMEPCPGYGKIVAEFGDAVQSLVVGMKVSGNEVY